MGKVTDLAPAKIISFLKDIERKLPQRSYTEYNMPFYIDGEIPRMALNNEAGKMMSFVGLTMFNPDCIWADLPDDKAGLIDLTGSRCGDITIRLNKTYKRNGKATLAILAHEVCHKLLEYYGLYFPGEALSLLNEIYTELAAVFVGFGNVILTGYFTQQNNITYDIGYLERWNYEYAKAVTESFYLSKPLQGAEVDELNPLINDWIAAADKRRLFLDGFTSAQDKISLCLRNISMIEQAFEQIKESFKRHIESLDKSYFREHDTSATKPIADFCMAHPALFAVEDNQSQMQCADIIDLTAGILSYIDKHISTVDIDKVKPNLFYCPVCGKQNTKASVIAGEKKIVKCKDCKSCFYIDCTYFNPKYAKTLTLAEPETSRVILTPNKPGFWSRIKKKLKDPYNEIETYYSEKG